MGCRRRYQETAVIPDEPDTVDAGDILQGLGMDVWRRERGMRRFKSTGQAQRFLGVHAAVYNLFNLGRHLILAEHYRNIRGGAFERWAEAVARFQIADSQRSAKVKLLVPFSWRYGHLAIFSGSAIGILKKNCPPYFGCLSYTW